MGNSIMMHGVTRLKIERVKKEKRNGTGETYYMLDVVIEQGEASTRLYLFADDKAAFLAENNLGLEIARVVV